MLQFHLIDEAVSLLPAAIIDGYLKAHGQLSLLGVSMQKHWKMLFWGAANLLPDSLLEVQIFWLGPFKELHNGFWIVLQNCFGNRKRTVQLCEALYTIFNLSLKLQYPALAFCFGPYPATPSNYRTVALNSHYEDTGKINSQPLVSASGAFASPPAVCLLALYWCGRCHHIPAASGIFSPGCDRKHSKDHVFLFYFITFLILIHNRLTTTIYVMAAVRQTVTH